jgi:Ca2+-binding RTX toxin-like protein
VAEPFRTHALATSLVNDVAYSGSVRISIGGPAGGDVLTPFNPLMQAHAKSDFVLANNDQGDRIKIGADDLLVKSASFRRVIDGGTDGGYGSFHDGHKDKLLLPFNSTEFNWSTKTSDGEGYELIYTGRSVRDLVASIYRIEQLVFLPTQETIQIDTTSVREMTASVNSATAAESALVVNLDGSPVPVQQPGAGDALFLIDPSFGYSDAGDGDMTVTGTAGDDIIALGAGSKTVNAGAGADIVAARASSGVLRLFGEAGDDILRGGPEGDHLDGGEDNDGLHGGGGDDTLVGGDGNDEVDGGEGTDTYVAGGARDEFVVARSGETFTISGRGFTDTVRNVELFDFGGTILDLRFDEEVIVIDTPASAATETHEAGGTALVLTGAAAELFGDTVTNFGADDTVRFLDQVTGSASLTIVNGVVGLASAPDGPKLTLQGDFAAGRFHAIALPDGNGTDLFFASALGDAALGDGQAVDAAAINGNPHMSALWGDGARTFSVTLSDLAKADFTNALGVYEIRADGSIVDARILIADAKADTNATASITGVEAGHRLGFFLVGGGAASDAAVTFVDAAGEPANVLDGSAVEIRIGGAAIDGDVFHSFSDRLNDDGLAHVRNGADPSGTGIRMAFEDMLDGGDRDFQDVVFRVNVLAADGDVLI